MRVLAQGRFSFSARCTASYWAPEMATPPPTSMTGRLALLRASMARSIRMGSGAFGERAGSFFPWYSIMAFCTSFGTSISTGSGRPLLAIWKARCMVCSSSSGLFTRKFCFVIGIVMPQMSTSWKASWPMVLRFTCPVMATTGIESRKAFARPVTRFVAPGPEVAQQTPTVPLALA